jgi:hypothetical protein
MLLAAAVRVGDERADAHPARHRHGQRSFNFTPVEAKDHNLNAPLRSVDRLE